MPRRDTLFVNDSDEEPTARYGPWEEDSDSDLEPDLDDDEAEEAASTEEHEPPVCLCRQPELGWMIGCDSCDEWFHGDCVDLIQDQDEQAVHAYSCPDCTGQGRAQTVWTSSMAEERYRVRREAAQANRILEKEKARKQLLTRVAEERVRRNAEAMKAKVGEVSGKDEGNMVVDNDKATRFESELAARPPTSAEGIYTSVFDGQREMPMDASILEHNAMDFDDIVPEPVRMEASSETGGPVSGEV